MVKITESISNSTAVPSSRDGVGGRRLGDPGAGLRRLQQVFDDDVEASLRAQRLQQCQRRVSRSYKDSVVRSPMG